MPRLQDDVNLPLVGSNGDMGKMALIVNWTRITGDQVTGTIVLQKMDNNRYSYPKKNNNNNSGYSKSAWTRLYYPNPPPSATSTRIRSTSAGLRSARTSAACGARPGRWIRLSCGMYLESRFGYAPPAGIKTPKRSDYALGFTDRNSIVKEILRKIKSIDPSHRGRHEAPFSQNIINNLILPLILLNPALHTPLRPNDYDFP